MSLQYSIVAVPTTGRRKKRIFRVSEGFFSLLRAAKMPQMGHFVSYGGVFEVPQKKQKGNAKGNAKGTAKSNF